MKIQHLKIKNIASIEEASIDFEHGPLADDPLFLITGDTGTGKTTILNAICLALYNDVPSSRTIGTSDEDREGLKTKNPLQLMRKGTVEAYVELRFIGNNDHSYHAKWMAARARKKVDGTLKLARELTDLSTQQSCKGKDIDKEIPVVVGLTFDQFTRTTMLAQGQFATFMKASDNDKSDILEKLTGTEIYSTIGQRINQLSKEKLNQFNVLETVLKQAQLLTPEEKHDLIVELETSRTRIQRYNARIKTLTDQIQWLTNDASLRSQLEKLTAAEKKAADEMVGDTFTTNQDLINEWEDTREVRSWIAQSSLLEDSINEETSALDRNMKQGLIQILSYQRALEQKIFSLKQESDNLAGKIQPVKHLSSLYDNAQLIGQKAQALDSARLRCQKYQGAINNLKKDLSTATEAESKRSEELDSLLVQYNAQKAVVKELETTVNDLNIPALNQEHNDTLKLLSDTKETRSNVAAYISADTQLADAKTAQEKAKNELAKTEKSITDIAPKINAAKAEHDRCDAFLQGQMELADHIASLREKFAETNTCPLCGSHVDQLIGDAPLNDALQQARRAAEDAKASLDLLTQQRASLLATQKVQAQEVKTKNKALESAQSALNQAESKVKGQDIDYKADNVLDLLDGQIASLNAETDELANRIKDGNQISANLQKARASLDQQQEQKDNAQKLITEAKNKVTNIQGNLSAQEQNIATAQKETHDILADLNGLPQDIGVDPASWLSLVKDITGQDSLVTDSVVLFASKILERANEYNGWVNDHANKSRECDEVKNFCDSLANDTMVLLKRFPLDETSVEPITKDITAIRNALSTLKSKLDVTDGKISQARTQLAGLQGKISQWHTQSGISPEEVAALAKYTEEAIREIQSFNKKIYDGHEYAVAQIKVVEGQIDQHQKSRPQFDPNDTLEKLTQELSVVESAKDETTKINAQVDARLEANAENEERQRKNQDELEQLRDEKNDWAMLDNMFGTSNGGKFRKIAQSYVLRALLVKANYYLRMLTSRYQLDCDDGSLTINVIDRNHGDSVRNVGLLSGGESFVVSLALALGLSAISKEKIHVDTLFIDEGFGTLDKDVLDTVITTLDRLHAIGGRRIGIISHVQDLKDRIPTQIRLLRSGPSSSRVSVTP